jgi:hypothetical protein
MAVKKLDQRQLRLLLNVEEKGGSQAMAKNKKRFKIIDKGNHVIKKDLMTSTVYSYPKEEENNTKK